MTPVARALLMAEVEKSDTPMLYASLEEEGLRLLLMSLPATTEAAGAFLGLVVRHVARAMAGELELDPADAVAAVWAATQAEIQNDSAQLAREEPLGLLYGSAEA